MMNETLLNDITEFTRMHDDYERGWNEALLTGDTSRLERMAENYYVTFFHNASDKPMTFSRSEAISGMKQSVEQLRGARKIFENRVIRLKDSGNAVVFFEMVVEKNGEVLARLFTTEYWQRLQGIWLLARETEEQIQ